MKKAIWSGVIFFLLGLSTFLTVWGFWPPEQETREIPLQLVSPKLALPEERTLRLEFSPSPRLGDSQIIQLRIFSASMPAEGNSIYEEYTVIAEARLDMPAAQVRPAGVISAPLVAGGGRNLLLGRDSARGWGAGGHGVDVPAVFAEGRRRGDSSASGGSDGGNPAQVRFGARGERGAFWRSRRSGCGNPVCVWVCPL